MGKYGQSYGQISTTNNLKKLFVCPLIVEAYRATLLLIFYFGTVRIMSTVVEGLIT
jgi:hypothetical protein